MKKSSVLAVSFFAGVAAIVAQAATSGNTFGVQRVDSTSRQTIVAIPWVDASASDSSITVANIIKTANLVDGDLMKWFNPETKKYQVWELKDGAWNAKTVASTSGGVTSFESASTQTLERGQAIGLERIGAGTDLTQPFYVQGQVPANTSITTQFDSGTTATPVYTLFAPPIASESGVNVNDPSVVSWANVTAATNQSDGDQIIITTSSGSQTLVYSSTEGKWGRFTCTRAERLGSSVGSWKSVDESKTTILPGCGAWYVSRGGTESLKAKVTWTVQ